MPISHFSKWYGVNDAKVSVITSDPSGGSTVYATAIDVPGIKAVTIDGDINTAELRGDGQRLDFSAVVGGLSLSFEFAKMDLDVLEALLGGTVTDSGSGPNEVATFSHSGGDALNYFKFESQTTGVDTVGGDGHLVLYKCILSSFPTLGHAEEDYQTFSVEAGAMKRLSDGKVGDVVLNETATAIA